uniref:Transcription factor TFIIB cyclin-like domain-containing protein n=1 Tax=viral metagenome TaxID=1070528 RepID=A0A6C0K7H8_9ZZZZ
MSVSVPAVPQKKTSTADIVSKFLDDAWSENHEIPSVNISVCPTCSSKFEEWEHLDVSTCRGCGTVISRCLDLTAEYRYFSQDDRGGGDPCRVGAPQDMRFPASSLGTVILPTQSGGTANCRWSMNKIRRYHTWNMLPYKERNLLHVFETFQITATNQGLDSGVLDLSKEYYVALVANCQKRGLSRSAILASCVFSALKQVGQPRKPKEVADMFHIKTSDFTKAFKYVQEVLALAFQKGHLKGFSGSPSSLQTTRASHYIAHPLSRLPLKRSEFPVVLSLSTRLADIAEDLSLCSEHMPPSLAAASLAEAIKQRGHKDIPVETIAGLCDVSAGTLLKCWKRIEDTKKQWLPLLTPTDSSPNTESK